MFHISNYLLIGTINEMVKRNEIIINSDSHLYLEISAPKSQEVQEEQVEINEEPTQENKEELEVINGKKFISPSNYDGVSFTGRLIEFKEKAQPAPVQQSIPKVVSGINIEKLLNNVDLIKDIIAKYTKIVDEKDEIIESQARVIDRLTDKVADTTQQLENYKDAIAAMQLVEEHLNTILTDIVPIASTTESDRKVIKIDTKNYMVI
jgi:hypothetical protein